MFKLDIVVMEMESQLIMLLDFINGLLRFVVALYLIKTVKSH